MDRKRIVIVGAGFGGIYTYQSLPRWVKASCDVTIIDRRNHFLFTPLLPEVAGASLDQHSIVEPIRDIVDASVTFIRSTVVSVNTDNHTIELPDRTVSYDILVLALGSTTHFFGTPGAESYAYVLKDLDDAVVLKNRFIDVFDEAARTDDPDRRRELLRFIIVGGGPTGVELAGEAADLFFHTFADQFTKINMDEVSLTIVNSGEILSMFDDRSRSYASAKLTKAKVNLLTGIRVSSVTEHGVVLDDGTLIPAETIIWTAGVSANALTCSCGSFDIDRGRIKVTDTLEAIGTQDVFAIGDMSLFPTADGRGLPMTAQVAKQQGQKVGKNIGKLLKGESLEPFRYREKGLLASLGSFDAIAELRGLRLRGFVAWFLWRTIYLFNFASWKKRFKIMADWTVNLFSRRDTTRL